MRVSGLLLHIASLPNAYGIGTMGPEAYRFVDYLVQSGQSLWQVLPLSPTGYGDSPYQSVSVYAGNPYLISLERLEEAGLLKHEEYAEIAWYDHPRYIEYGRLYEKLYPVLRKAFLRFMYLDPEDPLQIEYDIFCEEEKDWLEDYAMFMALKQNFDGKCWNEWPEAFRDRNPEALAEAETGLMTEREFWCFLQFAFFRQWRALKAYANDRGISIIGDMPIYCAYDSADVWCHRDQYLIGADGNPTVVAGFPPDGYSADGQLWGNPIYNWQAMKADGYDWWVSRISFAKQMYDYVRIDHFIGFVRYYAVPFGQKTAAGGSWCEGPAWDLFQVIARRTGKDGIIAEDLGIITPEVLKLLDQTGYPRMKVLQFAFFPGGKSEYLPQNYDSSNCIVYTSTHDNNTVGGWCEESFRKEEIAFAKKYLGVRRKEAIPRAFMKLAYTSTATFAVTTIQDLWGYGAEARINEPATLGNNWKWRTLEEDFREEGSRYLRELTLLSNRDLPVKKTERQ